MIEKITEAHGESFFQAFDYVAHERKYLAFPEAPPLAKVRDFVLNNITNGFPQRIAVDWENIVEWCDILPRNRPI
jgi:hypothetical protein